MALTFASTDYVSVGSGSTLDNVNAGSAIWWMYPTTLSTGRVWEKDTSPRRQRLFVSATVFSFLIDRTVDTQIEATHANLSTVAVNKWCCMAAAWNTAGAAGDQRLYHGDLTTALAEAAAYSTQAVGSGTPGDNSAATMYLGNNAGAGSGFQGALGVLQYYNRVLTLGELRQLQYSMGAERLVGCVGWWQLGDNGTGTQPDLSGNGNNGTVTGTTVRDNAPLRRWGRGRGVGWTGAYTASAGAYTLTATAQTYALTGTATGLTAQRLLTATAQSYALTGLDVGLTAQRLLTATPQSYALTGTDTGLVAARLLTATPQSYTLTGVDVGLVYGTVGNYTLTASAGSFALTGNVTGLLASRLLTATPQTYVLTGVDAALAAARLLTAASRSYALTGQDAGLLATRLLTATAQSYVLTGVAATLTASGAVASNPFRATWVGGALYLAIWEGGATYQAAWTGGSTYRATWRTAA